jgi:protein-S-isoprenylcysteine O-methyltransferase Ste14
LANFFATLEWILFVIWVVFWLFWLILAYKTRSPAKSRQSSLFPLLPLLIVFIWILMTNVFPGLLFIRIVPEEIIIWIAGIAITLAGLGFAIWARLHLGTNWSGQPVIRVHHTLVRTGPYKFVRHPIYTGLFVAFAGTALAIGEFWAFFAIFVLLAAFIGKIRLEEKVLAEEFGASYIQYKKEVKALIPFIL